MHRVLTRNTHNTGKLFRCRLSSTDGWKMHRERERENSNSKTLVALGPFGSLLQPVLAILQTPQRERERLNLVLYNTGSYKPCSTDGRKMERKRAGRVKERDILNRVLSADRWTMERTRGRGGKRSGIMYW